MSDPKDGESLVRALEEAAKTDRALLLRFVQAAEKIAAGNANLADVGGVFERLATVQQGSDGVPISPCPACGGPGKVVTSVLAHSFVACVVEPQCGMIGPTRTSAPAAVAAWNRLRCAAEPPKTPKVLAEAWGLWSEVESDLVQITRNGSHGPLLYDGEAGAEHEAMLSGRKWRPVRVQIVEMSS